MGESMQDRTEGSKRLAAQALKGFARDVSLLYAVAEQGDFIKTMQRFLVGIVPFDYLTVFCQKGEEAPQLLWSSFQPSVIRTGVRNYVEATHVVDPFTRAFRRGAPPGAYRGVDMAAYVSLSRSLVSPLPLQVCPGEELGFRTSDWPENLAELQIVFGIGLPAESSHCCQVGLYREPGRPRFSKADAQLLTAITPLVSGSFTQYWRRLRELDGPEGAPACFDLLSPRERTVIELVSQGFSSEAISALLQVSIETVKTHRKRAYRKLEISSQAELFALMRPDPSVIRYHA